MTAPDDAQIEALAAEAERGYEVLTCPVCNGSGGSNGPAGDLICARCNGAGHVLGGPVRIVKELTGDAVEGIKVLWDLYCHILSGSGFLSTDEAEQLRALATQMGFDVEQVPIPHSPTREQARFTGMRHLLRPHTRPEPEEKACRIDAEVIRVQAKDASDAS